MAINTNQKIIDFVQNRRNKHLSESLIVSYNEQRLILEALRYYVSENKTLSEEDKWNIDFLIGDLE